MKATVTIQPQDFNQTVKEICKEAETHNIVIFINDIAWNDKYKIIPCNTNLGLGVQCYLNNFPSFQAYEQNAGNKKIYEVINAIAGGEVANADGWIDTATAEFCRV